MVVGRGGLASVDVSEAQAASFLTACGISPISNLTIKEAPDAK